MAASTPTRVCVLSPDGRGAVAVVRVWGPGALDVADAAFRPARGGSLAASPAGRLRLGRMGAGLGDEVVAVVVAGGENGPEVEIQCHGGPTPVGLVVEALAALGAERRQPSAWVRHAARSAIEAEALVDLARAPTVRTAEILLEQAEGALEGEVRGLIRRIADAPDAALPELDALRGRAGVGLRLISGWRVVLAGKPNVGKSRLLNALAGYGRAIVDATPGTTRDVVTVRSALDGWPVELADTAGLRDPADAIEAAGIALARARHEEADLVLIVLDRSQPLDATDRTLIEAAGVGVGVGNGQAAHLTVANKSDLAAAWEPLGGAIATISAERGDGIEALTLAMARRLVPSPPPAGAGVPFRPAHVRRLDRADAAMRGGDLPGAVRHLTALLEERTRRGVSRLSASDPDQ